MMLPFPRSISPNQPGRTTNLIFTAFRVTEHSQPHYILWEDFTLEIRIPVGMDREKVMNECIRHTLKIEDEFGFAILTRVREA